ncbi:MAG: hypothetical protein D6753_03685 [Planctomycetota bacterium]|nr:MAG: hypothetical protein D6753_03685 [Planctomycetota bacterium]
MERFERGTTANRNLWEPTYLQLARRPFAMRSTRLFRSAPTALFCLPTGPRAPAVLQVAMLVLPFGVGLAADDASAPVDLQYKLVPGQKVVTRVEHYAETYTIMAEQQERGYSRTVTQKTWQVERATADGHFTFVYSIDWVQLAQSVGEAEEISYDSRQEQEVPPMFRAVAETVGTPLARVTIDRYGRVIERDKTFGAPNLGMGELTVPLPGKPVRVGDSWDVEREARAQLDDGTYKRIKLREHYTLEKVSSGVASIRVDSQPLTPITSPAVESQIIQQLSHGVIKFDIDRGLVISKHLEWDEEVVGFRGPNTSLRYDAKFVETLQPESLQSARGKTTQKR